MTSILNIPISLDQGAILENLSVQPGSDAVQAVADLINIVKKSAQPKALYKDSFIDHRGADTVTIDGVAFTSRALQVNLKSINRVFPYIVTTGLETSKPGLKQDDILHKYWLENIDLKLVEYCMHYLREEIQHRFRTGVLSAMNPGSGEQDIWPIKQQRDLFSLFGGAESEINVTLLPSFLMQPERTTSGILFPSETRFENCQLCKREDCEFRRAPFNPGLWESMQA